MKKIVAIALLAASSAIPAHAVIVGASVGYLTDAQDTYIAARVGGVFNSSNSINSIGEFEIGYTSDSEGGAKASILPLTLNYRAEFRSGQMLDYYLGAGAGMARTRVSGFGVSDSDSSFVAQAFAGASFRMTDNTSFDVGLRYIWLDDVKLAGQSIELGDDLAIEAGMHFRF